MTNPPVSYEVLIALQVFGTVVAAVGLFTGGLTLVTVAGVLLILAGVVGLAAAALATEREDVGDDDTTGSSVGSSDAAVGARN